MTTSTQGGANSPRHLDRASQWRSALAISASSLLLFELFSGLSVYLLPFSIPNQMMVLIHTAAGFALLLVGTAYLLSHWLRYRSYALNSIKLSGYIACAALALCAISGVLLIWQSIFGRQIEHAWDVVHVITTFVIAAAILPHVALIYQRDRRAAGASKDARQAMALFLTRSLAGAVGLVAVALVCAAIYRPVQYRNEFPPDYSYPYGKSKPFQPSLATTESGGAYDAASLSGSKECGQSGCHEDIYKEWSVSAHRWASMDPAFQAVQNVMAKQNGPDSTRYCGGCHDPISLFSGTKNIFAAKLTSLAGYQEGISCLACHSIDKTDIKGNANYVIRQPPRYIFEQQPGAVSRFLSNYLIRAYPGEHVKSLSHRLFKSPEFCAACHKQFIDKQVNHVGWVQLQNQYDNWRMSHWNHPGNPRKTIECRECHMPLAPNHAEIGVADTGDYNRTPYDGKHRSHRFLGANQFIPLLLAKDLPGGREQAALTEKWLQGRVNIPEIADKWRKGPAVPIQIVAPHDAPAGSRIPVTVVITSNKVGHDFPTGPLDIIQSWMELTVTDSHGRIVFHSGTLDKRHFIEKGSFIFRAEPVDQYGNLVERHNLWEMVGVRYKRSIFPGFSDEAQYTVPCPADTSSQQTLAPQQHFRVSLPPGTTGRLHIHAQLMYRKFGQFMVNFVFGEKSGLTCPVTVVSTDDATVNVMLPGSTAVIARGLGGAPSARS